MEAAWMEKLRSCGIENMAHGACLSLHLPGDNLQWRQKLLRQKWGRMTEFIHLAWPAFPKTNFSILWAGSINQNTSGQSVDREHAFSRSRDGIQLSGNGTHSWVSMRTHYEYSQCFSGLHGSIVRSVEAKASILAQSWYAVLRNQRNVLLKINPEFHLIWSRQRRLMDLQRKWL